MTTSGTIRTVGTVLLRCPWCWGSKGEPRAITTHSYPCSLCGGTGMIRWERTR